jgi:lactate dehydrogenase-like 2-hydroxyacid dehydrogenase
MKIYYQDLYRKSAEQEKAIGASFCETLDELLAVADCVVLATPFGGSKLITKETLAKFKKGSKFVNIARGTLVDEAALVDALKSGHLSAVGLDVHENEPNVNKELTKMRNVTYVLFRCRGLLMDC